MIDFKPTAEMEAARLRVRKWHFRKYRGKAPAIAKPKLRSGPSVLELAAKAILPPRKSKAKRYEPPIGKMPLEDLADKSQRARLTIGESAKRNAVRQAATRAARIRPCPDCGDPINRCLKAKRCKLCAVEYNRINSAAKYVPREARRTA